MNMEAEKEFVTEEAEAICPCKEKFLQKCGEIHDVWTKTVDRMKKDLDACEGNPYIRETLTYKVEVFRNPTDKEPIDTFVAEKNRSFSFGTLLLAGGAALILTGLLSKK